jgi:hypothetical protein
VKRQTHRCGADSIYLTGLFVFCLFVTQGTRASTIFRQSEKYIAPLLKHFKAKDTPPELVPMLAQICKCLEQREYQNANDMSVLPIHPQSLCCPPTNSPCRHTTCMMCTT